VCTGTGQWKGVPMMNPCEITLAALRDAAKETLQQEQVVLAKMRALRAELSLLETEYVGLHETLRITREVLYLTESCQVKEEATSREVAIARMKGFRLDLGQALTHEVKLQLRK
jgi:hypothetical protein